MAAKRALIIANETYEDSRFPELPGAGADASGLREVLADPLIGEFAVQVILNGRTDEIRLAIEDHFSSAGRDDMLLLHISSHGRKDPKGRLHFIATNSKLAYFSSAIPASFVGEQISDSLSRKIVVMLDCCYSGAFASGLRTRSAEDKVELTELDGRGRIVITASTALQYSHEKEAYSRKDAEPSVFTQAVIEGLRSGAADIDGDGLISVQELYDHVHDEVRRKVRSQTPTCSFDRVEGSLILARNPVHRAPPPAEPGVPAEVQAAVSSPHAWQRIGALHEIGRRLSSVRESTRTTALDLTLLLASDADVEVAESARTLLTERGLADLIPAPAQRSSGHRADPAKKFTLGIDFGTTNSVMAAYVDTDVRIVPNHEGHRSTPSCVAFTPDGGTLVGDAAERQAVLHPDSTVHAVKLNLGTDWRFDAYGVTYSAEQIASMILRKLRVDAEEYLGGRIAGAIVTVPAYFNHAHRAALAQAAAMAELPLVRIMNEPTAAAVSYGLDRIDEDETIGVFDLGGGTCDVSILELGKNVLEVLATRGDPRLGGNDWDERIISRLIKQFREEYRIDLEADRAARQRLREAAETAKIELSAMSTAVIRLPYLTSGPDGPLHLNVTLTRSEFEEMTKDLVGRCRRIFEKAAKDDYRAGTIDHVVLVGGATRMPAIVDLARQLGGGREPSRAIIPEGVASGAAVQAAIMSGVIQEKLLLDVISLSLGVETKGGIMHKLVERNTTIPAHRSEGFTTADDNQPSMVIRVYQGEREMASYNKLLGSFELSGIAPAPRGVPQIEVSFDIDANGIVRVSAKDLGTGKEQQMTVDLESISRAKLAGPESEVQLLPAIAALERPAPSPLPPPASSPEPSGKARGRAKVPGQPQG
ncbi:Hsp70 family protein [Actinoplanes sp. GCM10030250]|uniref:caspase, EACC1-associated type n=1 Tax=Actinoplanes sp. GCM10030250 TaxID=3273376 RepID=UPI00360AF8EC